LCPSGLPTIAVTQVLFQCADDFIQNHRLITTKNLETEFSVSKGSANNITDALGYSKVCPYWVPQPDYHKTVAKEVFTFALLFYKPDSESLLSWISHF
jgi:hypothetical protein